VTGLVALRANVLTFAIEEVPIGDAEGYVATPTLRFPGRVHPRLPSSDAMGIEGFKEKNTPKKRPCPSGRCKFVAKERLRLRGCCFAC